MRFRKAHRYQGLTLIELMVALTISLFVILVIESIYSDTKQIAKSTDAIARLQENAKFTLEAMANDIRMAGFMGCRGQILSNLSFYNTLNGTLYQYRYSQGIYGFESSGSSWLPTLDSSLSSLLISPSTGSDVITVWGADQSGLGLIQTMATTTDTPNVGSNTLFNFGDIALIDNCNSKSLFQVTELAPQTTGILSHALVSSQTPGNASTNLQRIYGLDATVYKVNARSYYIAPSQRHAGTTSLWRYCVPACNGITQVEELIDGVDNLNISYGVDTDSDGSANKYITANAVNSANQWSSVVSVKIQALFSTVKNGVVTQPQSYSYLGTSYTPSDLRLRVPMASIVTLRNRVP